MGLSGHFKLIRQIYAESGWGKIPIAIAVVYAIFDFTYEHVLSEPHKKNVTEAIRNMFGYWEYTVWAILALIVVVLYSRLIPKVEILFKDDGFHNREENGTRTFVVELNNRGEFLDSVSFRIDRISNASGTVLPLPRRGFEREDGFGPMPLSPDSPKAAYVASLDEGDKDSKIRIRTISSLASGQRYQPDPVILDRGKYIIDVSLNPRKGRPAKKRFELSVSVENGEFKMKEVE